MRQLRKFAHACRFDYFRRGKLRVQCECGAQSPVFMDEVGAIARAQAMNLKIKDWEEFTQLSREEQGRAWFEKHTGLVELHPRKRSSS